MAINDDYQFARRCTGGPTDGAKAAMSWYLGAYRDRTDPRPANLGIYACKRLGSGWSLHAEGRATDLGTAPYSKPPWGWDLAEKLRTNSEELGVQLIIFDRKIWSANHPHEGWRDYHGSNPHTGHVHVEWTHWAARVMTSKRINNILAGKPAPAPKPVKHQPGTRMLRLQEPALQGPDVRYVQKFIGPSKTGPVDGIYGPQTQAGVRWYQRVRGIKVDGVVGPVTWANLRVRWKG